MYRKGLEDHFPTFFGQRAKFTAPFPFLSERDKPAESLKLGEFELLKAVTIGYLHLDFSGKNNKTN